MNSFEDSDTPRICRRVRRWDAVFARSTGESHFARRHRAHCPDCEVFFAGDDVFEKALRQSARGMQVEAPTGLEQRILRAQAEAAQPVRGFSWAGAGWALAGAAMVAAVAFFTAIQPELPRTERAIELAEENRPADWRELAAPAREWVKQNPLEQEIASLTTNARSVLGFLALNFLPAQEDDAASAGEQDSLDTNRG